MAANDLRRRIERQLALGVHPVTRAPLTPLERFAYTAVLAGGPVIAAKLQQVDLSPAGEPFPRPSAAPTALVAGAVAAAPQPGADQRTGLPGFHSSFGYGASAGGRSLVRTPGAHASPITTSLPE